jgi:hypothetical protein
MFFPFPFCPALPKVYSKKTLNTFASDTSIPIKPNVPAMFSLRIVLTLIAISPVIRSVPIEFANNNRHSTVPTPTISHSTLNNTDTSHSGRGATSMLEKKDEPAWCGDCTDTWRYTKIGTLYPHSTAHFHPKNETTRLPNSFLGNTSTVISATTDSLPPTNISNITFISTTETLPVLESSNTTDLSATESLPYLETTNFTFISNHTMEISSPLLDVTNPALVDDLNTTFISTTQDLPSVETTNGTSILPTEVDLPVNDPSVPTDFLTPEPADSLSIALPEQVTDISNATSIAPHPSSNPLPDLTPMPPRLISRALNFAREHRSSAIAAHKRRSRKSFGWKDGRMPGAANPKIGRRRSIRHP